MADFDPQEFRQISDGFGPWARNERPNQHQTNVYPENSEKNIAGFGSHGAMAATSSESINLQPPLSVDELAFLPSYEEQQDFQRPLAKNYVGSSVSLIQAAPRGSPILEGISGRPSLPHKSKGRLYSEGEKGFQNPFADPKSDLSPSLRPRFKSTHTMNGSDEDAYDGIS